MLSAGLPPRAGALVTPFSAVARLPFGCVGVRTRNECVHQIEFLPGNVRLTGAADALAQRAVDQLVAYCNDRQARIDLPLAIEGNEFQRSVWKEIADIPCGTTRTYGDIAHRLNSTARAVGQACGDNRLPLAIPCHRVVAATGIGGFAHRRGGVYERIKRWLLLHEAGAVLRLT